MSYKVLGGRRLIFALTIPVRLCKARTYTIYLSVAAEIFRLPQYR